ncbi:hypothetical protein CANMA_004660 [Candida margitis]|uniref:uncharacterized protein n=1 Tax=Candida margitis TaxID=1775924 RepID=UPI0022279A5B|nr:uncharacterized protein CANMA_004660 [Candida margitis]KAI5953822.1 hypothetical protein CANMA_004660 [Candida margitis]
MSDSIEKEESRAIYDVRSGELRNILHSSAFHEVTDLEKLALSNEKEASKILSEAQANLEFSAGTGYASELRRGFSFLSILGIGFGLTNSWLGISASLLVSISSGGPMMVIYGVIILASISLCIGATLSEMASAMPNAAGQIYWAMKLAPEKYSRLFAYVTGIFGWLGALLTGASVTMAIATSFVGIYVLYHPDVSVQRWHIFLLYELLNLLILTFNIYEKPLPSISKASLFTSVSSCIIIMIVVLSMHKGEWQTAEFVFVDFNNNTGWSSGGIAFIVGLINPNWSFSCLDAAAHIAEESLNPAVQVPQAIFTTIVVGFFSAMAYSIAIFFSIRNLDDVLASNTGVPIMDIFYQSTESKAVAVGLEMCIVMTLIGCNIACHTWAARVSWSFSRDNGFPLSKYWSRVNSNTGAPVNAHLMSCGVVAVVGFIFLASTTAFNAVIVCCVTFLLLSYLPATFCLIYRRNTIKPGPFWLNKLGLFCNIVLICYAIFAFVFFNFPFVMPVTGGNMNYSSVVFAIVFIFCVVDWLVRGRKEYIGMQEREQMREEYAKKLTTQISHIEAVVSQSEA